MKNIHIFVDGPDGAGKTTLIKGLAKYYKLPCIKQPRAKTAFKNDTIEIESQVYNMTLAQFSKFSFIVDRSFVSSLVYSSVYNRTYNFSYMSSFIKKIKPIIIFLTGSNKVISKRKNKDSVIKNTEREKILSKYNEHFDDLTKDENLTILKINTDKLTKKQVLNSAIKLIDKTICL